MDRSHWNWWRPWRGQDQRRPPRCAAQLRDQLVNRRQSPTTSTPQEDASAHSAFQSPAARPDHRVETGRTAHILHSQKDASTIWPPSARMRDRHPDSGLCLIESGGDNCLRPSAPTGRCDRFIVNRCKPSGEEIPAQRRAAITKSDILIIKKQTSRRKIGGVAECGIVMQNGCAAICPISLQR